jgi:hypothetical protein
MIALVVASSLYLTGMEATISAPRPDALRACLKQAKEKATSEKVAGDAFEAYARAACSGQLTTLKNALIGFSLKNGMARKAAASDADMTIDDYVASTVDNYKFMAEVNSPTPAKPVATAVAAAPAAPSVTPPPTRASAPATPK